MDSVIPAIQKELLNVLIVNLEPKHAQLVLGKSSKDVDGTQILPKQKRRKPSKQNPNLNHKKTHENSPCVSLIKF